MDLNLVDNIEVWSISEAVKECLPFMMDELCLAPPLGLKAKVPSIQLVVC